MLKTIAILTSLLTVPAQAQVLTDLIVVAHLPRPCTTDASCERLADWYGCALYDGQQLDDHAQRDQLFICHKPTYDLRLKAR